MKKIYRWGNTLMSKEIDTPKLNKEQEKAAFCNENAIISAGAGSGKTMVLANRFIWLLTEKGFKIDEILTLTFTKKAAAEMFRRIHSLLTFYAEKNEGEKADRAREALENFIHARIQTLDSYSTAIVKQSASRYGISPDFDINLERSREIALEESLPFIITNRNHPAIKKLYADYRPNEIARNIFSEILNNYCTIDKQFNFTEDVKKQFNIICSEWENQINEIKNILNELEKNISEFPVMCPNLIPVFNEYKKEKVKLIQTSEIRNYFDLLLNEDINSLMEKSQSHPIQKDFKQLLYLILEINKVNIVKGRPAINPVKDKVKQIKNLYNNFSSLTVYCMQAGFMLSFMTLLNDLQDRFLHRKQTEGILTFNDIASLSRTILLEQKDIRQNEKEAFKAIMIDEFQDNNELQKDLLFLLAENYNSLCDTVPSAENLCQGKLFFVGDEKQSVYLFRGADVSVFRKLKDEIKSENLSLKINYRSMPLLIGAFNAIFGGSCFNPLGKSPLNDFPSVFAPDSRQKLPLYEAAYNPLEADRKGEGFLSICILNGKEDDDNENNSFHDNDENEARFVAKKIEQILNEKTEEGEPKYKPDDIAILFRSHSPQYLYEKHLRLLKIPYSCEDINDLFYSGVVNDIMSVLRLAVYPLDSAAYVEMLRSPFAGLSLDGTAVCLSIMRRLKTKIPFNDESAAFLDEEDHQKYLYGKRIYSSVCSKADNASISSLVSDLWYREGYRYETEWHPETCVYREYFDYLYHLAARADRENHGLAVFTENIRILRDSRNRLKDINIPLDRSSAVHLLTIHKSKGLEYPVVFVCCCGKYSKRNQEKNVYKSNESGIVLNPPAPDVFRNSAEIKTNFFWEKAKTEEKRKRTAELRRLLYVAMTRAEEKLFLTGVLDFKDYTKTDSLSIKIKNYIDEKSKNKTNYLHGDSILDNDTFFGILMPAVTSHILFDSYSENTGFINLEAIPVYTEKDIGKAAKKTVLKNSQEGLNEYINKKEKQYRNAKIIKTPVLRNNHISPASLRKNEEENAEKESIGRGFFINKKFSGEKSDDIFNKVDSILSRFSHNGNDSNEKFNSGSFGTIAHICVEAILNREEAVIPSNISGLLTPSELSLLTESGKELAHRFIISPLGKMADNTDFRESEFSFRSLIKSKDGSEIFINGVIDLFFENDNTIHIVDFKTDSAEKPADHTAQMSCYYHAINSLFAAPLKKQCRIWLYYLRTGHAVEITEKTKQFDIDKRIFDY